MIMIIGNLAFSLYTKKWWDRHKGHGSDRTHFLSDPMSDRKKRFSSTLRNIYKKTAWCTTLRVENAVNFLCTPK